MPTLEKRLFTLIMIAVITAGVVMRLVGLGAHPMGLYQDEAINGLDALAVWEGSHPLYFPANNGREPFFIYLMAVTIRLFGQNTAGLRAAASIAGILTIPATYFLGRAWTNHRVGLIAAAILAAMLWHVHLSRVGFRAVALPLWMALALGMGSLALRRRSRWWAVGAGAAYGLSFYTYSPVRFTPLALGLMLVYGLLWHREYTIKRWRLLALLLVAGFIVALPLVILTITQPELVLSRSGQVAIWNEGVQQGRFAMALWGSTWRTLGMFVWQGDDIWRHNVPQRPVFDLLVGSAFVAGVGLAIGQWRSRPASAQALIWTGVLLLPTLLAADAPHFLRAAGILPVVVLIPAVALDRVIEYRPSQAPALIGLGVSAVLILSGLLTAFDYFGCRTWVLPVTSYHYQGCYRNDPVRGYYFQAEATELAEAINEAEGRIYLDRRFWDTFPSIRFLVGETERIVFFEEGTALAPVDPSLTIFVWPHVDNSAVLQILPPGATIRVEPGPFTRGDLEAETYRLYVAFTAEPEKKPTATPVARFANGYTLIDLRLEQASDAIRLTLAWALDLPARPDTLLFVHVVADDGHAIVAQVDEPPGTIYYPALSWLPGSVIIQPVLLAGSWPADSGLSLRLGLYDPATNDRYIVQSATLTVEDNAIVLPLVQLYVENE